MYPKIEHVRARLPLAPPARSTEAAKQCDAMRATHEEETVTSEPPILNALVKIIPIEKKRQSVPASRAEGELHQQG